ncbi:MAG: NUDIX domain-containing protein [Rhodobacteraceae bacterium]|jgi:nudix-type nucleoside diphosphatase (YffH/AdpP family)|nr:NUDIX domain-containing protein [Paracoccaceae bacterium]
MPAADPVAPLFFFGTLRHAPLLSVVLGHDGWTGVPARLEGWRAVHAGADAFPVLIPATDAAAPGVLVSGLTAADQARLDFYEGGYGYAATPVTVVTDRGPQPARAFLVPPDRYPAGADWDLAAWQRDHAAVTVETAREYMGYLGQRDPATLVRPWATMAVRAASRLAARASHAPTTLRRAGGAEAVRVADLRRPYLGFFMVEEQDIAMPRFDGGLSPVVTRAAFVAGDAATVLPWDPVRDRVLLVEQFRFAPFVRNDPAPFSLEAIAGRIDPGETPEQAARREAAEEAGLVLGPMEQVAAYYPSPGAVTEFLTSFVACADLPDTAAGLGGVADEAEDIRAHVIPFDRLMALIATGEVGNAPLILTAFWLAGQRDRLRAAWGPVAATLPPHPRAT